MYGSRYISVDEILKVKNLMDELKDKIQFVDFIDIPVFDTPEPLLNSDIDCIKRIVDNHPEFNLETPISLSKGSIFLVCCEDGTNIDGIEYLIEKGAEITLQSCLWKHSMIGRVIIHNLFMFILEYYK